MEASVIDEFSRNPQEKEKTLVRSASQGKLDKTPRRLDDFFGVIFPSRDCNSRDERWIVDLLGMALDLQSPPHLKKSIISMVRDADSRFGSRQIFKIGSSRKSKYIENPCDFVIPCFPDPPTAIYFPTTWCGPLQPPDLEGCYDIILFENENENKKTPETLILFDPTTTKSNETLCIIDSCNGVLLCEAGCHKYFCLYNPTVDAYTILPQLDTVFNDPCSLVDMVIVFVPDSYQYYHDPNSYHYEIVALLKIEPDSDSDSDSESSSLVSVYSTRDGVWKDSCHSSLLRLTDHHGVFCGHAVYWLSEQVVRFDLDHERLDSIDHPFTDKKLAETKMGSRFRDFLAKSHQDTLLCVVFSSSVRWLRIWELGRGGDHDWRWSIRYEVDLGKACGLRPLEEIPSIDKMRYQQMLRRFDVLYFLDGAEDEDTFFVFRANGKAIRYHVASGRSYQLGDVLDFIRFSSRCLPFQRASTSGM